jgi:menaquinone-dependent protoporphyrinogen oxidase
MRVLVATASRHEATREIGTEIGRVLRDALPADQFTISVEDAANVTSVDQIDAAVVGSAVYMGHWLDPAKQLAEELVGRTPALPVWLFSSGPIGDPPKPEGALPDIEALAAKPAVVEHVVLAGRVDKSDLKLRERAVVAAVRAAEGDFRDWDRIREWAGTIAIELGES